MEVHADPFRASRELFVIGGSYLAADKKSLSVLRDVGPEFEAWGAVIFMPRRCQIGL
jgi:hypothetical protein